MASGTNIATAYVQVKPTIAGIKDSLQKEMSGAGSSSGESYGASLVGKLKGVIAAAGIAEIVKTALEAGGNLQQSFGGLDTIYGEASQAAKDYAKQAATAGISMNDYAEQAVSFGASLKQAFEGDVTKAAEAANVAILDMADNSAKMGTDISAVQSAYQGFAKQNYTMLDNLKLGYGGTKTEMERLLADAEKLSGVHYDIDNLGDVYSAIHVIQEDLGLTGVAAEEAAGTFTGSFQAMKAAATNLLADLTTGADITEDLNVLGGNIQAFIVNNLVPMLGNLIKQLPTMLQGAISALISGLNQISENADSIVQISLDLIQQLILGIAQAAPALLEAVLNLILALGKSFIEYDWKSLGHNIIEGILNGLKEMAHKILDFMKELASRCLNAIKEKLGIASPSKVFAKEVGQWIPAGIAVGIEGNMDSTIDAMDELSDMTIGSFDTRGLKMATAGTSIPNYGDSKLYEKLENIDQSIADAIDSTLSKGIDIRWDSRNLGRLVKTYA